MEISAKNGVRLHRTNSRFERAWVGRGVALLVAPKPNLTLELKTGAVGGEPNYISAQILAR